MIEIEDSKCICGKCNNIITIQWEVDMVSSTEEQMGESCLYEGENIEVCPNCGNEITAKIRFAEYPVGALNYGPDISVEDSFCTNQSKLLERPGVYFFDM